MWQVFILPSNQEATMPKQRPRLSSSRKPLRSWSQEANSPAQTGWQVPSGCSTSFCCCRPNSSWIARQHTQATNLHATLLAVTKRWWLWHCSTGRQLKENYIHELNAAAFCWSCLKAFTSPPRHMNLHCGSVNTMLDQVQRRACISTAIIYWLLCFNQVASALDELPTYR